MRALLLIFACAVPVALAQQDSGDLAVYQLRPNFYMIAGAGSNVAVQIGSDGVVVVDPGSAAMADKVVAAIKKLTAEPIRYIIDTTADADHAGANEKVAKAGENLTGDQSENPSGVATGPASILATEGVLNRMSAPSGKEGALPSGAWPSETFFQKKKPIYLNHEAILTIAEPGAHRDGDAIVFFRGSDVIVAGEIIDTTRFPVVDVDHGGSIQGEVDALNEIVDTAVPSIPLVWQDGGTYVIPAHGFVCDQADVVEYRDMVTIIRDNVQALIRKGMTLQQVKAADPAKGFRPRYGADSGPWTTDMFVEAIYKSLTAKK